ncbi:hypothetical protein NMR31_003196 [Vibrio cholerae]|nr:hypothetical protein [Vibrio cholerae]EJL6282212.1 hypothetical protein [Vibrio cholerae]EJX9126016.1 hypothetical protein [Vibrio cholerae]EJY0789344.1 hypothetical protein [Vibrio cholerae]
MKQQTTLTVEARYQLTSELCRQINNVAGHQFDNQSITLDFIVPHFAPDFAEDLLEIRVMHIGIEAKGYVRASELERLIGVEVKYLDNEYLAYLVTQTVASKGVHYQGYHSYPYESVIAPLFECVLTCNDLLATLYLDIASLDIDDDGLELQPIQLSEDLRLTVSWSPFETYLDTQEILALSDEDLVWVFPK